MGSKRIYFKSFFICSYICVVLIVLLSGCNSTKEISKISDLAYDENKESGYTVYLQEDSKYIPYLVLTNDYNGNTLLLRKETLDESKQYSDYIAYYKDNIVDKYLNDEFYELLGYKEKETILYSNIEITKEDATSMESDREGVEEINRRVFLLSVTEVGVKDLGILKKEGKAIKYFINVNNRVAYKDRKSQSWWLRTPCLSYDSCPFGILYDGTLATSNSYDECGIRPAFCINKNTKVKLSNNIIKGKSVFILG